MCLALVMAPLAGGAFAQEADTWATPPSGYTTPMADSLTDTPSATSWWASAELLVWWTKNSPNPVPLTTSAPLSAFFNPDNHGPPGALGNSDTTIVLGGSDIVRPAQLGGRFTLGAWLSDDARSGVEASFLFLSHSNITKTAAADDTQFLTVPFQNVIFDPAFSDTLVLNVPGVAYGGAELHSFQQVYGAELNGLWKLRETNGLTWQLLGGYRFFNVNEELSLATTYHTVPEAPEQLYSNTIDQFETQNYFNGGQLGLRGEWTRGNWFFATTAKVALGSTHEVVNIRGATSTNAGPAFASVIPDTTVPGGVFTQPTNIGRTSRNQFAVLPELTLRLGAQVTSHVRAFVGYNILYLSSIARPGDQIDGSLNLTQSAAALGVPPLGLIGPPNPAPRFQTTDFWAQGLSLGAEIAW